jgi:hypothetical protein
MRTARKALRRAAETSAVTAVLTERFEVATAPQVIALVAT